MAGAIDELLPRVYDELRSLAHSQLKRERDDHTLNTTALVHEAYFKLRDQHSVDWENKAQFLAVAAQAMRRILVAYARKRNAVKRGSGAQKLSLDETIIRMDDENLQAVLALDEALTELSFHNERLSRVVECRFFAGLEIKETAEALGLSPATVKRDWTLARAWLYRALTS